MASTRGPRPAGPVARDPTAPARLLDAVADIGLRVERAQREADGLALTLDRVAAVAAGGAPDWRSPAPAEPAHERRAASPEPGREPPESDARIVAVHLAASGVSYEAIAERLRADYGVADPAGLLAGLSASLRPPDRRGG